VVPPRMSWRNLRSRAREEETLPDLLIPPPDAFREQSPEGEIWIWQPAPRVVLVRLTGTFGRPLVDRLIEFLGSAVLRASPIQVFFDLSEFIHYTREVREIGTRFVGEHADTITATHFLLASKVAALGVSVFKHALPRLEVSTYSSRDSFMRSLAAATQRGLLTGRPAGVP
jgi:hypothetical protein